MQELQLKLQSIILLQQNPHRYIEVYEALDNETRAKLDPIHNSYEKWYQEYKKDDGTKFLFITLNFKPNMELETIKKLMDNIVAKKWVSRYYYSIEQRGNTKETAGEGLHVHLILTNVNKPMSQIHKETYNTVKNYVGNKLHVDVKTYPTKFLDEKLQYIQGLKWDSDKKEKTEMDKYFRLKNNLEMMYTN